MSRLSMYLDSNLIDKMGVNICLNDSRPSPRFNVQILFELLPWKIDDFVDEVGGKNGTADYTDFLGLVV
jgi:hypothetical protein